MKESAENKALMDSDSKELARQLEKDTADLLGLLKREKTERERDVGVVKERIENEKKELQICIDKDRDNFNRKMNEEHDQRRIEQMEMQQR